MFVLVLGCLLCLSMLFVITWLCLRWLVCWLVGLWFCCFGFNYFCDLYRIAIVALCFCSGCVFWGVLCLNVCWLL